MNGRQSSDKMDTINFLLTEVSLGLLGNKFFDINGNNIESLNLLVTRNSPNKDNEPPTTACENSLLKKLKLSAATLSSEKGNFVLKSTKPIITHPYKKPERLRRLSHSDVPAHLERPVNIPAKPQCAQIMARRSTCIGDRHILSSSIVKNPLETKTLDLEASHVNVNRTLEKLQRDLNIGNFF